MRLAALLRQSIGRRPIVTAGVCGTLAVSIGATTAIFAIVDGILIRPLPYPAADRLMVLFESNAARRQATALVAPGRLEEWNEANRSFDGLTGSYFENLTDTTGPEPARVEAIRVAPRFFEVLGTPALVGRTFTPDEERFGGPTAIVLAEQYWRRRYSGDPAIVGRTLTLGGAGRLVVGIMPASFEYPNATTDAWLPIQAPASLLNAREARFLSAIGRLKPGVDPAGAQADLAAVQARLGVQFPKTDAGWTATVVQLKQQTVGRVRSALWLLLGAVLLLLVSACANIACVILADAVRRERELAVRVALGASLARLVTMLAVEGATLAATGAALGLLLAVWGLNAIRAYLVTVPRASTVHFDMRVILFAVGATIAATMMFAVAPALYTARHMLTRGLAGGGRTVSGGRHGAQRALVTVQIALAVVLVSGAGLLVRSFIRLQAVSPGFQSGDVLSFRISAQWNERTAAVADRQLRTLQRLGEIPGVQAAALSQMLPAALMLPPTEVRIVGRDTGDHVLASARSVSAGYFATLRIPLLQGTTCADDPASTFQQAVVTRSFADRFFPGENPVGHWIEWTSPAGLRQRIVGVAGDVREDGLAREAPALIYSCGLQPYWPDPFFLVHTDGRTTAAMIRAAVAGIEPKRAMYAVRPLDDVVRDALAEPRVNAVLLSAFAGTTMLLATLGLYGVLAQLVAARRREIGIRVALGAPAAHVLATVASPAVTTIAAGLLAGVAVSLGLARLLQATVPGVSTGDALAFALAPAILASAGAAATLIPARRAARVDPAEVLRDE